MSLLFKFMPVGVSTVDDDTLVECSSGDVDRTGDIVVQEGIDLSNFKRNPIVLWQHNTNAPIARASQIAVRGGKLTARVSWPPLGVSQKSDEIRGLVKAGVISAVSIGFTPIEAVPLDMANPKRGPQKYLRSELGEFSFVSVPANPNALVIQRALLDTAPIDGDESRTRRLRELDFLKATAPAPLTRSERLSVVRQMESLHFYRTRP